MAITRHLAELLLAEHRFRNISGNVLLLGRQTVFMTPDQALALVEKCGIKLRAQSRVEIDKTPFGRERGFISDVSFFSLFADASVTACDVSDFEGADIIFSLSDEPPAHMIEAYDFIYNGSVLDNVFDPAACIRNISRMMKPEGVVFHYEGAAHCGLAYTKFTPDWFFDFYALNQFADFQAYLCTFPDVHISPWSVFEWSAYVEDGDSWRLTMPMKYSSEGMVVAIAQKSPSASVLRTPIQNIYRSEQETYQTAFCRFAENPSRLAIRRAFQPMSSETAPDSSPRSDTPELKAPPKAFLQWARQSRLKSFIPVSTKRRLLNIIEGPLPAPGHRFLGTVG